MSVHEIARRGAGTWSGKVVHPLAPLIFRGCRAALAGLERGSVRLTLPSGHTAVFRGKAPGVQAAIVVRNQGVFWKSLRRGGIGFAESYMNGDWTTPDLGAVLRFFLQNRSGLTRGDNTWFRARLPDRLFHRLRRNTRRGSRRNIAYHYDLGNAFYARWLDASMMYSSAYFTHDGQSLEAAQRAKSDLILDMLEVAPGERMLEIGCGWGGFALHAARERGMRVHGITLSPAQLALASQKAREAGLDERCTFQLLDYRDVGGTYDRLASIEMVEAVGADGWPTYFRSLRERLKPGGVAVIQAITIDEALFDRYRRRPDFIQRYIFPGGMLPTVEGIRAHAAETGLAVESELRFGPSYARTLREWRRRFLESWPAIRHDGFDKRFRRMWSYYLTYCEVGFDWGTIDVGLYKLRRP